MNSCILFLSGNKIQGILEIINVITLNMDNSYTSKINYGLNFVHMSYSYTVDIRPSQTEIKEF